MYEDLFLKYIGAGKPEDYRHGSNDFYKTFLLQTDFITAKISEDLINTLQKATITTFAPSFLAFIKNTYSNYSEILSARQYCREKLESGE